jgi:hypothetical protein
MTHLDSVEQEDAALQADPVLSLSGGPTTSSQVVASVVVAAVVLLGTLYGLTRQSGVAPPPTLEAARTTLSPSIRDVRP